MRLALLISLAFGTAAAQQTRGLTQFLGLTPAQVTSVNQFNGAYTSYIQAKAARENIVQAELAAEYSKASPNALALGQRYIELDSIAQDMTAAAAHLQAMIAALLTPAQAALVQQIASATVQQSLNFDASCGYLEPASLIPTFAFRSGDFSVLGALVPTPVFSSFLLGYSAASFCPPQYPISIRNYLSLTDSQVSGILLLEAAYDSLKTRKDNRTNDVELEIRDETAKPMPDPLALGVRYAELAEISQELKQTDNDGRMAARNLLTPAQQDKLKTLIDTSALSVYQYPAGSCHFLASSDFARTQCQLN